MSHIANAQGTSAPTQTRLEVGSYHVLDRETGRYLGSITTRSSYADPGEEFQACAGHGGSKMVHTIEEGEAFILSTYA